MSTITIKPIKKFNKTIIAPPDKSITQRAILFASLAPAGTKIVITNALLGLDCLSCIECVMALGAKADVDKSKKMITITSAPIKSAILNVGNSGTAMRLLMGMLSAQDGKTFTLDGDESIRNRPMGRVSELLEQMGAKISLTNGKALVAIEGAKLIGTNIKSPIASAQIKSAILLAGIQAKGVTSYTEPYKSRDHTERLLKYYGVPVKEENNTTTVSKSIIKSKNTHIVGDISSVAFPLVLAVALKDAKIRINSVGLNPTRCGTLEVFKAIGANFNIINEVKDYESFGDIEVEYIENLSPFTIDGDIIPRLIDEIPILAVLACFIKGTSVIRGAEELKVKESNRLDAVVDMLSAMGGKVEKTFDGMIIYGSGELKGGCMVDSKGDHRIAMATAIAGALSKEGVSIKNHECVSVSYPEFFNLFEE